MAPFRFMELPPELRLEVYRLLVVVGKVFYTPDWYDLDESVRFEDHATTRPPSLTLLRVSKAIHAEAEDLYPT